MTNGVLELGVATLFYITSVSLISATVIVVWVGRTYLDVPASRRRVPRRD